MPVKLYILHFDSTFFLIAPGFDSTRAQSLKLWLHFSSLFQLSQNYIPIESFQRSIYFKKFWITQSIWSWVIDRFVLKISCSINFNRSIHTFCLVPTFSPTSGCRKRIQIEGKLLELFWQVDILSYITNKLL